MLFFLLQQICKHLRSLGKSLYCKTKKFIFVKLLGNPGSAPDCPEANAQETSVGRKESLLYSGGWQSGQERGSSHQNQLGRFCSAMTVFKGKKGRASQWVIKAGGQALSFTVCARWRMLTVSLPMRPVCFVCLRDC